MAITTFTNIHGKEVSIEADEIMCPGSGAPTCRECWDFECQLMNGQDAAIDRANKIASVNRIFTDLASYMVCVEQEFVRLTDNEMIEMRRKIDCRERYVTFKHIPHFKTRARIHMHQESFWHCF